MATWSPQRHEWESRDCNKGCGDAFTWHTHKHIHTCTPTLKKPVSFLYLSLKCFPLRAFSSFIKVSSAIGLSLSLSLFPSPPLIHAHTYTHCHHRPLRCDLLGATEFGRWHFKGDWLFIGNPDGSQRSRKNTHTHIQTPWLVCLLSCDIQHGAWALYPWGE